MPESMVAVLAVGAIYFGCKALRSWESRQRAYDVLFCLGVLLVLALALVALLSIAAPRV